MNKTQFARAQIIEKRIEHLKAIIKFLEESTCSFCIQETGFVAHPKYEMLETEDVISIIEKFRVDILSLKEEFKQL